jgi:hypothetical protein
VETLAAVADGSFYRAEHYFVPLSPRSAGELPHLLELWKTGHQRMSDIFVDQIEREYAKKVKGRPESRHRRQARSMPEYWYIKALAAIIGLILMLIPILNLYRGAYAWLPFAVGFILAGTGAILLLVDWAATRVY